MKKTILNEGVAQLYFGEQNENILMFIEQKFIYLIFLKIFQFSVYTC